MTDHNALDPDKDKFKNDGFAHTPWTIPKRDFDFNAHDWEQRGTQIICNSCPIAHASSIPVDKMLVKVDGKYDIVPVPILS